MEQEILLVGNTDNMACADILDKMRANGIRKRTVEQAKSILLNKTICGYNAINYSGKTSCGKLKKIICKQFGIDSDAIFIEKI